MWSDEFNGASLNTNNWTNDIGNGFFSGGNYVPGWGNNEDEYYTGRTQNVYVANGYLHIAELKQPTNGLLLHFGTHQKYRPLLHDVRTHRMAGAIAVGHRFLAGTLDAPGKFALRRLAQLGRN